MAQMTGDNLIISPMDGRGATVGWDTTAGARLQCDLNVGCPISEIVSPNQPKSRPRPEGGALQNVIVVEGTGEHEQQADTSVDALSDQLQQLDLGIHSNRFLFATLCGQFKRQVREDKS